VFLHVLGVQTLFIRFLLFRYFLYSKYTNVLIRELHHMRLKIRWVAQISFTFLMIIFLLLLLDAFR